MKHTNILLLIIFGAIAVAAFEAFAGPLDETRYCGPPSRDARGEIKRRADVLAAFQRIHPCPSTMLTTGHCPDYEINHIHSMACGACDSVDNMMWMHVAYKHGYVMDGGKAKPMGYLHTNPDGSETFVNMMRFAPDRVERKIGAMNPPIPDTAACANRVVK